MKTFKIALIGECMIELQEMSPGNVQQTFGGDTLNTAIYMTRIATGLPVAVDYVTAVGQDPFSEGMVNFWEKENVGSSLVQRIEGKRPGLYYIQLDESGERYFHYWRSDAAARGCFEYPGSNDILKKLEDYDAIYLSGISLAILLPESLKKLLNRLKEIKAGGTFIHFDCNYRPHLWKSTKTAIDTYHQLFTPAHTVLLNTDEGEILLDCHTPEEIHSTLKSTGVVESIIRNGASPCSISYKDTTYDIPAVVLDKVVDTTAAGDSFSAAYLLARRYGLPVTEAAQFSHKTAAYVISHKGAIVPASGIPLLEQTLYTANS